MMKPWIGLHYEKPKHFKNKTLVLGESSYGASERFDQNRTIDCVERHLGDNSDKNFSRFAVKIKRTVHGEKTGISNGDFWSDVAFYNFVQPLVGSERERPTDEMWLLSKEPFEVLCAKLKPDQMLVLGHATWEHLSKYFPTRNLRGEVYHLCAGGQQIRSSFIAHPSSYGFRYADWRPRIRDVLS